MTLKEHQIDRIIEFWLKGIGGVEAIAKKTRHSKNTIKRYLRLHGYLPYQYSPDLYTGPSSLISPSLRSINKPKPVQQGGRFQKVLEKKDVLLENAYARKRELEQQVNTSKQNLDQKNDEYKTLMQEHATTVQKLDESNKKNIIYNEEFDKINQQIDELIKRQQSDNQKFSEMKAEKEIWEKRATDLLAVCEADKKNHPPEEHLREIPEQHYGIQTTIETPSTTDEKTEESTKNFGIKDIAAITLGVIGGIVTVYLAIKNPVKQIFPTTLQYIEPHQMIPFNENQTGNTQDTTTRSVAFSSSGETVPGTIILDQDGMTHSGMSNIVYEMIPLTIGNNTIRNQSDLIQLNAHSGLAMETTISGIECSRFYCSSHFENIESIPKVTTVQSFPFQTYVNYVSLPSVLPDDLSEVYPMKYLLNLDGITFEIYLENLLKHKEWPVERTKPSHDKGVDLIATLDGVKTVIQAKQRPKVGIDTIQRICAAKISYQANRAIVITTGTFTKDALEEAQVLGVECWDGKRLLQEIYKVQYFSIPT